MLLTKALQALKEDFEDCDKSFFNVTLFQCFQLHLFRFFPPQLNDQADSNSFMNTHLLHLVNENNPLKLSNAQRDTDAEKREKEEFNVFTQTELDTSSGT